MAFDQLKVGQLSAELMENLEQRYSEDAEIGDVCLIVEVITAEGSEITMQSSTTRRHVNIGLLEAVRRSFFES